ncbi:thioesterase II family protein [Kitasatospora purpeofusca]|uniref:thioesterase II family protein n=1 Tax=Kitasatospora purpeofusca TaxID=67352 RepID=UPI0035DCCD09
MTTGPATGPAPATGAGPAAGRPPAAPGRSWLRQSAPSADTRLRLFCLPFAGGGASAYHCWQAELPPEVELLPVHLPGRGTRLREPAADDVDALAADLLDGVRDWLRPPYAWYGHSMGAALAHRVVAATARRGLPAPELLAVAARRAPHLPPEPPLHHTLPRPELIERLRVLGATPEAVLADPRLLDTVLTTVRADFRMVELAPLAPVVAPLDVPVVAFGGSADPLVGLADLRAWHLHTTRPLRTHVLAGGHFFHLDRPGRLVRLLSKEIGL